MCAVCLNEIQMSNWETTKCMTCKALALMLAPIDNPYFDEIDIVLDYFETR